MRKFVTSVFAALTIMGCSKEFKTTDADFTEKNESGEMIVNMVHEFEQTKAKTSYVAVLDDEKAEHKVDVLVFDKNTGQLAASKMLGSVSEECSFTMPVGLKLIYVVVNGPDLSKIQTLEQLRQVTDDLTLTTMKKDGFVMIGNVECSVTSDVVAKPVIVVKRLVARVVLQKITCSIPVQYGAMHVDCVFLGNAYSRQTYSGVVSEILNKDGYAGIKADPIGKDGVKGACEEFFFRNVDAEIASGASSLAKYHMYCHPNTTDVHTCMYILATIGGVKYYYRVPLYNKLGANTTCSVDVDIVNLGSTTPPDSDIQKGEIVADIKIDGWDAGESYSVRF